MASKSVEERLERLERELADLRARVVEATEFRLVDKAGNVRGVLAMTKGAGGGPRLALIDADGVTRVELTISRDGPGVMLGDERGDTRLWLGVTKDAARVGLADAKGNPRAFVGVGKKGPTIDLYDAKQRSAWHAPAE